MKQIKIIPILLAILFLFSGCKSGSDKDSSSGKIATEILTYYQKFVKIKVTNNSNVSTGSLRYSKSGASGFEIFMKGSPNGICTTELCPDACEDGSALHTGGSCYIYIHALDSSPSTGEINIINHSANQTIVFGLTKLEKLYVGGTFTNALGKRYVAKFDPITSTWTELLMPTYNTGQYIGIYTMSWGVDGNLYASGSFKNSLGKQYVAKFDPKTSTWTELPQPPTPFSNTIYLAKFDANGNLYVLNNNYNLEKFDPKTLTWTELATNFNSSANDMNFDATGNLYIGGNFTNALGERYVAKFDPKTSTWTKLPQPTTPFNATISTVTFDAIGNLYIGGNFINAFGEQYVAKFDPQTEKWTDLPQPIAPVAPLNSHIQVMNFDATGNLYIGGNFTNAEGKRYVGKFDPQTLTWTELPQPTAPFNNFIMAMSWGADDNLYTGGDFTNPLDNEYVAKFDPKTSTWTKLPQPTPPFNGRINTMNFSNDLVVTRIA